MKLTSIDIRKFFLFLFFIATCGTVYAQDGLFIGAEYGLLSDLTHFRMETGEALSQGSIGGMAGLSLGLKKNKYAFSTGILRFRSQLPLIEVNRDTGKPERKLEFTSVMETIVVPLRVAREFKLYNQFYFNVGVGILGLFSRDAGYETEFTVRYFIDSVTTPSPQFFSGDSTETKWKIDNMFNMAIETSLALSYKTQGRVDFFLRAAYQAHFNPTSHSEYTFYSDNGVLTASGQTVNSFTIGLGMNFLLTRPNRRKSADDGGQPRNF